MFEDFPYRYIVVKIDNRTEINELENTIIPYFSDVKITKLSENPNVNRLSSYPNYVFINITVNYIHFMYYSNEPTLNEITYFISNTNNGCYNKIFNMSELRVVIHLLKTGNVIPNYKPRKRIKRTLEKTILRFTDFDNLEFRKGSLEYGGLVSKLLEFLRIYKNENEDELVFNIKDFEKASNLNIDEIIKLNELPNKKSLYNFNVEIKDDKIIFSNLENKKSVHDEPVIDDNTNTELMIDNKNFGNDIRGNYTILGVDDFYEKIGDDYKNPHLIDIEKCIEKIIQDKNITFDSVLDLGAGNGEITSILNKIGIETKIIGCDPYLYKQYERNTGKKCLDYSFEDIHRGAIDHMKFDTIICSYSLHLCNESILPELLWKLSLISDNLIIISPNNKPVIKEENGWVLLNKFKIGKSKCSVYNSKNTNL
jgi:hypothetical protein